MQFLLGIELATEQAAEDAQAQGIDLSDVCRRGQPIAHLTQYDTRNDRGHQQQNHVDDVVCCARAYRLINETTTEPDHRQTETDLHDARHYAYQRVPADTARLLPKPPDVFHAILRLPLSAIR